eukprot:6913452-Heterocapsa_arctica.AAC.1
MYFYIGPYTYLYIGPRTYLLANVDIADQAPWPTRTVLLKMLPRRVPRGARAQSDVTLSYSAARASEDRDKQKEFQMTLRDQRATQKLFTATLEDHKLLADLKPNCSTKDAEYEEVKKNRSHARETKD